MKVPLPGLLLTSLMAMAVILTVTGESGQLIPRPFLPAATIPSRWVLKRGVKEEDRHTPEETGTT